MFSVWSLLAFIFALIAALVGIGIYTERRRSGGTDDGAIVYSLSLAIYCTSWTYYGSIGLAAKSGFLFTAIYLGPTLALVAGYPFIRRLIQLKNRLRISSLADLLSIRYGKSAGIGALIAIMASVGIIPYIALQLKAIVSTAALISGHEPSAPVVTIGLGSGIAILMVLVTIFLGMSQLDSTRRHRGLIMMLSLESVLKLVFFLIAGAFVTYRLAGGMGKLFQDAAQVLPSTALLGRAGPPQVIQWFSQLLLAGSAILFLPRQFHVTVVENSNQKHLRTACWLLPLYLVLINIFVLPVAIAGLSKGYSPALADSFLLLLPLESGHNLISLMVFLGGFLAASAMVTMETVTVSTMVVNYLVYPLVREVRPFFFLRRHLLKCRWFVAAVVVALGYFYMSTVGNTYALVAMGTISFVAVIQFAPATFGAIYWSKANKTGAYLGLIGGFLIWSYTLFLPAFAKSGWLDMSYVSEGIFGIALLRPESLLGLNGLDPISHGTFWSLLVNAGLFVVGSLWFPAKSEAEERTRLLFELPASGLARYAPQSAVEINRSAKEAEIFQLFSEYFPRNEASQFAAQCLRKAVGSDDRISILQLAALHEEVEKTLSGAVGPVTAHSALMSSRVITSDEGRALSSAYGEILANMKLSPTEIKRKIDFFTEREALLAAQAAELRRKLAERDTENAAQTVELRETNEKLHLSLDQLRETQQLLLESSKFKALGEMSAGLAHEINTPLAMIHLSAAQARELVEEGTLDRSVLVEMLGTIEATTMRIGKIVQGLRTFSRDSGGDPFTNVLLSRILVDTLAFCEDRFKDDGIRLTVEFSDPALELERHISCRPTEISQVLLNLLNNARDAIIELPEKWIRIQIKDVDEWLQISVTDSGQGLSSELGSKIFVPFFTTKPVGAGTGLGLSVSKGIIEAHGGSLMVNHENLNTCFVIRLPRSG